VVRPSRLHIFDTGGTVRAVRPHHNLLPHANRIYGQGTGDFPCKLPTVIRIDSSPPRTHISIETPLRGEIGTTVFVPATGWESDNRAAWRKT